MNQIQWIRVGAIFGVVAVGMGAFGAHALKNVLDEYSQGIYAKAVLYQMFHTAAIIAVGIIMSITKNTSLNLAGFLFSMGIILFSGSLYVLAITGVKLLGMITPFGGLCFIGGWIWLFLKAPQV